VLRQRLRPLAPAAWLGLAGLVALYACDRPPAPTGAADSQSVAPSAERVLRRGHGGEPGSLDPQRAQDHYAYEIQRDLYEGLTSEAVDGSVVPGVAERWTVSADGLVYRFELRESARWSDGSPVQADHFVAAYRVAVDPATVSPAAEMLRSIANARRILEGRAPPDELGVRAVGPRDLEITLEHPVPFFLSLLTHPVFYPRHPTPPAAGGVARTYLVSNGPFRFLEWTPNSHITVVRNPFYWDATAVQIDRVVYYPIAAETDEYLRYRAGDLDVTAAVPANRVPELLAQRSADLQISPYLGTYFLGFNLQRAPFASNPDLRLALSLAIDREALAQQVLQGTQAPAYGLVPVGTAGYRQQSPPWAALAKEVRLEQARALYARAVGADVRPLKVRVIYGNSQLVRTALIAVAAMWKEAFGLEVDIVSEEFRSFLDTQRDPGRWEILRMAWVADYNDASNFLEMFRSGGANNPYGYANPQFDGLLDQAQRTLDPQARAALLEEAERTLLADQAFIPVFHLLSKRLVSPRVIGLQMNPLNRVYSRHLRLVD